MSLAHELGGENYFPVAHAESLNETYLLSSAENDLAYAVEQPGTLSLEEVRDEVQSAYDSASADGDQAELTVLAQPMEESSADSDTLASVTRLPVVYSEQRERAKSVVKTRAATPEDLDRIVELDLKMFRKAYGEELPSADSVRAMMASRLENVQNGGWMMVCEVDGKVEAFISAFRTNKAESSFVSWEDSTSNGTLDGVVDPDGRYVYISNMTVGAKASKFHGREMIMTRLFGEVIKEGGVEYGYFESRLPQFRGWLNRQGIDSSTLTKDDLDHLADTYASATEEQNGKRQAVDFQVRMYENAGMERGTVVADAFQDPESLGYGIVFKAKVPQIPKPFNKVAGGVLTFISRFPTIAAKIM